MATAYYIDTQNHKCVKVDDNTDVNPSWMKVPAGIAAYIGEENITNMSPLEIAIAGVEAIKECREHQVMGAVFVSPAGHTSEQVERVHKNMSKLMGTMISMPIELALSFLMLAVHHHEMLGECMTVFKLIEPVAHDNGFKLHTTETGVMMEEL